MLLTALTTYAFRNASRMICSLVGFSCFYFCGQGVLSLLRLCPSKNCSFIIAITGMHLHELRDIELGFLDNFNLPDGAILERINCLCLPFNLLAHGLSNEILDK